MLDEFDQQFLNNLKGVTNPTVTPSNPSNSLDEFDQQFLKGVTNPTVTPSDSLAKLEGNPDFNINATTASNIKQNNLNNGQFTPVDPTEIQEEAYGQPLPYKDIRMSKITPESQGMTDNIKEQIKLFKTSLYDLWESTPEARVKNMQEYLGERFQGTEKDSDGNLLIKYIDDKGSEKKAYMDAPNLQGSFGDIAANIYADTLKVAYESEKYYAGKVLQLGAISSIPKVGQWLLNTGSSGVLKMLGTSVGAANTELASQILRDGLNQSEDVDLERSIKNAGVEGALTFGFDAGLKSAGYLASRGLPLVTSVKNASDKIFDSLAKVWNGDKKLSAMKELPFSTRLEFSKMEKGTFALENKEVAQEVNEKLLKYFSADEQMLLRKSTAKSIFPEAKASREEFSQSIETAFTEIKNKLTEKKDIDQLDVVKNLITGEKGIINRNLKESLKNPNYKVDFQPEISAELRKLPENVFSDVRNIARALNSAKYESLRDLNQIPLEAKKALPNSIQLDMASQNVYDVIENTKMGDGKWIDSAIATYEKRQNLTAWDNLFISKLKDLREKNAPSVSYAGKNNNEALVEMLEKIPGKGTTFGAIKNMFTTKPSEIQRLRLLEILTNPNYSKSYSKMDLLKSVSGDEILKGTMQSIRRDSNENFYSEK